MKTKLLVITVLFAMMSCKKEIKQDVVNTDYSNIELDIVTSVYPENITKVFEAHGGIDSWNTNTNLVFDIVNSEGNERTTTNLKNRKSLIETDKFKIGFDGQNVWLKDNEEAYKGNAKFYYNLMFYFYAMPFILGDDGIIYEDVTPLDFEGDSYPGIKISYESGVGESPDDEYILYYNPETYVMEWLSYTVTYFTKEKNKNFRLVKYNDWETVNGLRLPKVLQWYEFEDGKVGAVRNEKVFKNVTLAKEKPNDSLFIAPEGAKLIE